MKNRGAVKSYLNAIYAGISEFGPWLLAGMAAVFAGLATNVVWDAVLVWREGSLGRADLPNCIVLALFFFSVWLVFRRRDAFFRPRTRYLKDILKVKPRQNMVLFLSNLNYIKPPEEYINGIPSWLKLSDPPDYGQDYEEMEKLKKRECLKWNWQMPLHAVYHHRERLQRVILICSDSETSIGAVHHFVNLCRRYEVLSKVEFSVYRKVRPYYSKVPSQGLSVAEGLSFDSFDQLSKALWRIFRRLQKRHLKESEVVIDFTGGMKVTSVVAAAITFNRRIIAQYINTKTMHVTGYDVVFSSTELDEQELV